MDEVRARVLDLVQRLLRSDKLDTSLDFFDHGANSVLLIQIVELVNEEFDTELTITDAFDAPDIDQFIKTVADAVASSAAHGAISGDDS